jgi:pimeloyl-ACP methyl ester carboxylesterase
VTTTSASTTGDVTHDHVTVNGMEVMVHRAGAGKEQALVFLHGGGPGATGWSNWRHALPALGSQYDCIAPDWVGFGDSHHPDPPPADPRAWNRLRIDMVLGLLDELGIERASLVGNSLGGAISLHLLMEAPERFERAVLMGTAGGPSSHHPRQEVLKMVTFYNDPSPEALARLYSWFIYDLNRFDGDLDEIARDRFVRDAAGGQALVPGDVRRPAHAVAAGIGTPPHHASDPARARPRRHGEPAGGQRVLPARAAERRAVRLPALRALDAARVPREVQQPPRPILHGRDLTECRRTRRSRRWLVWGTSRW